MVGFQRFLYLVGNHDWKNSPLMVNLNDEFTGKFLITGVNWSTCTGLCDVYIGTITHVQSILCIGIMLNLEDESIGIFMYQNQKGELLTLTCTWNIKRIQAAIVLQLKTTRRSWADSRGSVPHGPSCSCPLRMTNTPPPGPDTPPPLPYCSDWLF